MNKKLHLLLATLPETEALDLCCPSDLVTAYLNLIGATPAERAVMHALGPKQMNTHDGCRIRAYAARLPRTTNERANGMVYPLELRAACRALSVSSHARRDAFWRMINAPIRYYRVRR